MLMFSFIIILKQFGKMAKRNQNSKTKKTNEVVIKKIGKKKDKVVE
jgi:hypothetical protein